MFLLPGCRAQVNEARSTANTGARTWRNTGGGPWPEAMWRRCAAECRRVPFFFEDDKIVQEVTLLGSAGTVGRLRHARGPGLSNQGPVLAAQGHLQRDGRVIAFQCSEADGLDLGVKTTRPPGYYPSARRFIPTPTA